MKKLSGAAFRSHVRKVVRSIEERTKCGVTRDRAIAIEIGKSHYLAWGDVAKPIGE